MDIRQKIQTLLAAPNYHPLHRDDLGKKLRLTSTERRDFRRVLADMLDKGEVIRVRTDHFVLPRDADHGRPDGSNLTTRGLPSCGPNCCPPM